MRTIKTGQTNSFTRKVRFATKGALFVLLFAFIFSGVLLCSLGYGVGAIDPSAGLKVADAAAGENKRSRAATAITLSHLSHSQNVLQDWNKSENQGSTYANKFGLSTDHDNANAISGFKFNTHNNVWGYQDLSTNSDKAYVWWLEFTFSGDFLKKVKAGNVSFYFHSYSIFSDGVNDETGVAISCVGVNPTPSSTMVDSSRSGDKASWYNASSNFKWSNSWSNSDCNHNMGSEGVYSSTYQIPTNATGICVVFGAISDWDLDGGHKDLVLRFYCGGDSSMTSSNATFNLSSKNYQVGDDSYFVNTDSLAAVDASSLETGKIDYNVNNYYSINTNGYQTEAFVFTYDGQDTWNTPSSWWASQNNFVHHNYLGNKVTGFYVVSGHEASTMTYAKMKIKLTLSSYVRYIDLNYDMLLSTITQHGNYTAVSNSATWGCNVIAPDGTTTSFTDINFPYASQSTDKYERYEMTHVSHERIPVWTSPASSTSVNNTGYMCDRLGYHGVMDAVNGNSNTTKTVTIEFVLTAQKADISGNSYDRQSILALIGSVNVGLRGQYFVKFDGNDATNSPYLNYDDLGSGGSTYGVYCANTNYRWCDPANEKLAPEGNTYHGHSQTMEWGVQYNTTNNSKLCRLPDTLRANTYTRSGKTMVGWATSASRANNGTIDYADGFSTNGHELTSTPGGVITLYAVWKDSDFEVQNGKNRDSTWGSASNPFVINTNEHWQNLIDIVNQTRDPVDSVTGTYYGRSITTAVANGATSFYGAHFVVTSNLVTLSNRQPVGTGTGTSNNSKCFRGHLYGGNINNSDKTERRLDIQINATTEYAGAFNYVSNATIEYIHFRYYGSSSATDIKSTANYIGAFVGWAANSTFNYCRNEINVNESSSTVSYVGGIVGYANACTFTNCTNQGKISGGSYVGGIAGYSTGNTSFSNCTNSGQINCGGIYAGGTVGYVSSTGNINASNTGSVSGTNCVGGIAGYVSSTVSFKGCTNTGNISGASYVGGIVGDQYSGTLTVTKLDDDHLCTSSGTITGTGGYVGGIVGRSYEPMTVSYCNSSANIISANGTELQDAVGGIVGGMLGDYSRTISNCTYSGGTASTTNGVSANVYGGDGVGGIVGQFSGYIASKKVVISNCTMTQGAIYGKNGTAGIIGRFTQSNSSGAALEISGCKVSAGTISGTYNAGGIAGRMESQSTTVGSFSLHNCYNAAAVATRVTDGGTAGGIVGYLYYSGTTSANKGILKVEYCYNHGNVNSASNSNAGGIVGNATTSGTSPNNCVISYCYCDNATMTAGNTGGVVGAGTNTVENSWAFYQNSFPEDVGGQTTKKGAYFMIDVSSGLTYKVFPSTSTTDQSSQNWEAILANNIQHFRFGSQTIENGKYLRISKATTSTSSFDIMDVSAGGGSTINNPNATNTTTTVTFYNAIFAASLSSTIIRMRADKANITLANSTQTRAYLDEAPAAGSWIVAVSNPYSAKFEVEYYSGGAWSTTAPTTVGTYNVRVKTYLNSSVVSGVKTISNGYQITKKNLQLDTDNSKWTGDSQIGTSTTASSYTKSPNFTYNKGLQGVNQIKLVNSGGVAFSVTITFNGSSPSISVSNSTYASLITTSGDMRATNASGTQYTFTVSLSNTTNFTLNGSYNSLSFKYTISPKSIAPSTPASTNDITFHYSPDGIASETKESLGYPFATTESPYTLVYRDTVSSVYAQVASYMLHFTGTLLAIGTDYTLQMTAVGSSTSTTNYSTSGTLSFASDHLITVSMTFTGTGNYSNTKTVRFTLMDSDFGGNFGSANWGSESNPYLIESVAHLARLSQIVNGVPAWNSIHSASTDIAAMDNAYAVATSRTYANSYFRVANAINARNSSFVPIGVSASNYFAGNFNYNSAMNWPERTIGLSVAKDGDYSGLFGYVKNAYIHNIKVEGTISGAANFVGGIAGYIENGFILKCTSAVDINSSRTVANCGDYVGGLAGMAVSTKIGEYCSLQANVKGKNYVGEIAGYWQITVATQSTPTRQIGTLNLKIEGDKYVGGIVGWLDAKTCTGLTFAPQISAGSGGNAISVTGKSYVGGLYGGIEGAGYKKNSTIEGTNDTKLYVTTGTNTYNTPYIFVKLTLKSGGYVAGGVVGYASGIGIIFLEPAVNNNASGTAGVANWYCNLHNPITFDGGGNTSFMGGVAGVLGENATIESAKQTYQNGDSVYQLGGVVFEIGYTNQSSVTFRNNGDFVGGVVGYIASTAGSYYASNTTLMGNSVRLVNRYAVSGATSTYVDGDIGSVYLGGNYKGGIIGGMGRLGYAIADDTYLSNLVAHGTYSGGTADVNSTLRYAPLENGGNGRLMNFGNVLGGDYVGGIVGYVGMGTVLAFVNEQVTSSAGISLTTASTYLTVYNGKDEISYGTSLSDSPNIVGQNYIGGYVGYIASTAAHVFTHAVSRTNVVATNDYVGGIVGYMASGNISGSLVTGGYLRSDDTITNVFRGKEHIGGLVGHMEGGTLENNITRGFKIGDTSGNTFTPNTSATKGGVVGSKGVSATITSSWAIHLAEKPDYTTISFIANGKYIIIDKSLVSAYVNFSEYAKMVGLFAQSIIITQSATSGYNASTFGMLSHTVEVPHAANNHHQLVFYDVSGTDTSTNNTFSAFTNQNNNLYMRWNMATAASFSVCKIEMEFKNVEQLASGATDAAKKAAARDAYRAPASGDPRYTVDITTAEFTNLTQAGTYAVSKIAANAYFNVPGTETNVLIGSCVNEYTNNDVPLIIKDTTEWNKFAKAVRDGTYDSSQLVMLGSDNVEVTAGNLAGTAAHPFSGVFDGDGHSIKITLTDDNQEDGNSMFPFASGATFKNTTTTGSISQSNKGDIAAFVGRAGGDLKFENCVNDTSIYAYNDTGGFVGATSENNNGGHKLVMVTCVNRASITTRIGTNTKYEQVEFGTGGLVGHITQSSSSAIIESCKNEGTIVGGNNIGGVVGFADRFLQVYNSANTGSVTANLGLGSEPNRTLALGYAGGVIGKVGSNGYLWIFASYNAGTVVTYGSISGGIVAGCGSLEFPSGSKNTMYQAGRSRVAYCYNSGTVKSGGTTFDGKESDWHLAGREELNGVIAGGVLGAIGNGDVTYCYNIGNVTSYQVVGYGSQWQMRTGGICAQAQPNASNAQVKFNYCYNIGQVEVMARMSGFNGEACYGASICAYMDEANNTTNTNTLISRLQPASGGPYYNYVLHNALHYYNETRKTERYLTNVVNPEGSVLGFSQTDIVPGRYVAGVEIPSIADFTTYMDEDGNLRIGRAIGTVYDGQTGYEWSTTGTMALDNNGSGTRVDTFNQASSLINSSGNYYANFNETTGLVTYDSNFTSANKYGYVYIYGCLPQLAPFALDSKEGLSMLSISYGRDIYDEYRGAQAGSAQSPYVIKDGVDLLAMSALTGATSYTTITGGGNSRGYYNFHDKYIAVADGTNNLEGVDIKTISMDMDGNASALKSSDSANASTFSLSGKNYFLWNKGAASGYCITYGTNSTTAGITSPTSSTQRTTWCGKNHYFNGAGATGSTMLPASGTNFHSYANLYPIGRTGKGAFSGIITGKHGESGQTTIKNVKVSSRQSNDAFAGLFGSVFNASISYLNVIGSFKAYTYASSYSDNVTGRVFAGAIAGYAGGGTVISNCTATNVTVTANTFNETYAAGDANDMPNLFTSAGGIVGGAGSNQGSGLTTAQVTTLKIENCNVVAGASAATSIASAKNNIGGIAGFVGDPWGSTLAGDYIEINNCGVQMTTTGTLTLQSLSTQNQKYSSMNIGGIVGANDGYSGLTISGCQVGGNGTIAINGETCVGGIMGTASGNATLSNCSVASNVVITRKQVTGQCNNIDDVYYTSIGGIIGRTITETVNAISGTISFAGRVNAQTATASGTVRNIGGIIGTMGNGTRVLGGSNISIGGTLVSGLSSSLYNIGGFAGLTMGGAIDGYFDITITMTVANAENVGGVIGYNAGDFNFLSSSTVVNVDGTNYTGTTVNMKSTSITAKKNVGGLVGFNSSTGSLRIGDDWYLGSPYNGQVKIVIGKPGVSTGQTTISATGDNVGGLVGSNEARGLNELTGVAYGLVLRKGVMDTYATVSANDNVGGIIGLNSGDIETGGSQSPSATLLITNRGNVSGTHYVGGVIGYLGQGMVAGEFSNLGVVTGTEYIGGSIGYVNHEAKLMAGVVSTYFINGQELPDSPNAGTNPGGDAGKVQGVRYVGGSVGAMFGTIEGHSHSINVCFENYGNVISTNAGESYLGGNIGILAGSVSFTHFLNNGTVSAPNGTKAIGGSVGFVGKPEALSATTETVGFHNVHFEFSGSNAVTAGGTSSGDEFMTGGVGGAIGTIDEFPNAGGSQWQNVTLYTSSDVVAANLYNVGGAIGLIKADNIAINNMLAFYSSVVGNKNVGGIIGAVTGSGVSVDNSFNVEGTVAGTIAGGIIGRSNDNTTANTSYWFKGYSNVELMALNINQVTADLGKYVALLKANNTPYTKAETDSKTPAEYTGNEEDGEDWATYLSGISGRTVFEHNGVWVYSQSAAEYTTGTVHTGWYFLYANDRESLDSTHTNGSAANFREQELVYWKRIADAYTEAERENHDDTATLSSPIVAAVNEMAQTVAGGGTPQNDSIYATAMPSTTNGEYLYMVSSGNRLPSIHYGAADDKFFIKADTTNSAGNATNNAAVYYRSVGIEGDGVIYNGYNRYLPINNVISETKTIEYVDMLPMSGEPGSYIYTTTKKYTGDACEAGTYLMDVNIYYCDDFGNYAKIGGIENANLVIKPVPTELAIEARGSEADWTYNGDNTSGTVAISIKRIMPLDTTSDRDVVLNIEIGTDGMYGQCSISLYKVFARGTGTTFTAAQLSDSQSIANLAVGASTKAYLAGITITPAQLDFDRKYISDVVDDDATAYDVELTFKFLAAIPTETIFAAELSDTGRARNYDAERAEETFVVKPKEVTLSKNGAGDTSYYYDGKNHQINYKFDGWVASETDAQRRTYINQLLSYIKFVPSDENATTLTKNWTSISTAVELTSGTSTVMKAEYAYDIIKFTLMKLEGEYYIGFGMTSPTYLASDGNSYPLVGGNYYVKAVDTFNNPKNPLEVMSIKPTEVELTWGPNSGLYNGKYHEFVATLDIVQHGGSNIEFDSAAAFKTEMESLFNGVNNFEYDYEVRAVTGKQAKIAFFVGPNQGNYNVSLPGGNDARTTHCDVKNSTTGTFTITKLAIKVGISGDVTATYNGGSHTANDISIEAYDVGGNLIAYTALFNSTTGKYTVTMFSDSTDLDNDTIDNQFTVSLVYKQNNVEVGNVAVNVGTYTASANSILCSSTKNNFELDDDQTLTNESTIVIEQACITIEWNPNSTFTYANKVQGREIRKNPVLTKKGEGLNVTNFGYTLNLNGYNATLTMMNDFGSNEYLIIPVSGDAAKINAGSYTATVNLSNLQLSGTNLAGTALLSNYDITFNDNDNGTYTINKLRLTIADVTGSVTTKVYDALTTVTTVGTPVFTNAVSSTIKPTAYTIRASYDNKNVGTNKTITYTVTLTGVTDDYNNFDFAGGRPNGTYTRTTGEITARPLTVRLDKLRSGAATKVYNGNEYYGGEHGATSLTGRDSARSEIYRSGEGFTVNNIAVEDVYEAVRIVARYAEADSGRSAFDSYVNNVVGTVPNLTIGTAAYGSEGYKSKKLVFTMMGNSASNYTFIVLGPSGSVNIADKVGSEDEIGAATVVDGSSGVKIEITPNILRASYANTAQSYANADNSYNHVWQAITGSANAVNGDILQVSVVNNWMYSGNNPLTGTPAEFKSHTVIRGVVGSSILSASLSSDDGKHINYQLSNQPVLTIGYFVDKNEFEIGSLASLIIATYYYKVAKAGDSLDFGEVVSQAVWNGLVSLDNYLTDMTAGTPPKNKDTNQVYVDDENNPFASWDSYFAYLTDTLGYYVFLNENGGTSEWGYYSVDESSKPYSFDHFKQIANVSGVFTEQDLAILNGMFKRVYFDGEGNISEEQSYDWGAGNAFLKNFIKGKVGDVVTVYDAIFAEDFSGVYDGNGYVIDKVNIVGIATQSNNYVGMFTSIKQEDEAVPLVTGVHLRNFTISVNGANNVNVGMLAGDISKNGENDVLSNVSAHGSIKVRLSGGTANIGGLVGKASIEIENVITLGEITVTAASAKVAGVVGHSTSTVTNAVSVMYIWTNNSVTVGGIYGGDGGSAGRNSKFMENGVWNNGTALGGGISYTNLYNSSVSGYGASNKYYYDGDSSTSSIGECDVLADVKLLEMDGAENTLASPHDSMRLADIINIYMLGYSKVLTSTTVGANSVAVYTMSSTSWLVGSGNGTLASPISIGNQQGLALMRELRFASFVLVRDVYMYSTYELKTASGAFFGSVTATGGARIHVATLSGAARMFEVEVGANTPSAIITAA